MAKNAQHWEKTRGLLFVTLAIWAIFSMGIFLFGAEMNEVTGPFGYPLTYWFTCQGCLLYTSPSPRDQRGSRMPSSA